MDSPENPLLVRILAELGQIREVMTLLLDAALADEEEQEDPPAYTLDGQPAGRPRDENEPL